MEESCAKRASRCTRPCWRRRACRSRRRKSEAVADADVRANYRILLDFRARLLAAPTVEACYLGLFAGGNVNVPPLFIDQLAQIILRNVLEGTDDALEAARGGVVLPRAEGEPARRRHHAGRSGDDRDARVRQRQRRDGHWPRSADRRGAGAAAGTWTSTCSTAATRTLLAARRAPRFRDQHELTDVPRSPPSAA